MFEGYHQYNRYSKLFGGGLQKNCDELARFYGCDNINEIGTQSARKGIMILVAAGCTIFTPTVSLCIRLGWLMRGVKEHLLCVLFLIFLSFS